MQTMTLLLRNAMSIRPSAIYLYYVVNKVSNRSEGGALVTNKLNVDNTRFRQNPQSRRDGSVRGALTRRFVPRRC